MTNKSTTHNREHFFILAVVLLLANQFLTTTVNAIYINAQDKSTITVNSGVFTVSFNSPCPVTLGYISYANYADLEKLKTSIPSTFTVISKDSTYYSSYTTYSFSGTAYFVLYNNGTSPCSVTTFTTSLDTTAITSSTLKVRLPYGVKTTFYRYYSSYRNLIIKSDGSSSMSIALKIEYLSTAPSTTPTSVTSTYTISGYDSKSIDLSTAYSSYYTAYIYLQCNNVAGCPVQLSLDYGSDSGSSTVIGAVVGPIVFVVIFVFIVIISVVSTIFARRRRMLLLAAATTAVATSSTTTHNYVPVPTPVSTTTTTTEKTTVYVPPPVTTTAQQPYIQPGVPQPYNPNYGNQAYYSQPPPTTGQPYQPQPYAQPYTSQPYTPQPYPNQPPPPYYNPGVGVAQQEPMPAFNPNVDRV